MELRQAKIIRILIALALAGILLAAGFHWGRPAYRSWRHSRALATAERFLAAGDLRNAALSARQALDARNSSVAACRVLAEVAERLHLPLSLQWRQRVLELEPASFTNRLAFARTAVLTGNFSRAAETLAQTEATNQNSSAFHQLAAIVEMGLNNLAGAEAHFAEAVRLDPTNRLVQLNRAIVQLQSKDPAVAAGALAMLRELTQEPDCRRDALRNLALAALRGKEFVQALDLARQLQADPNASLDDRLLHLQALKAGGQDEFSATLTSVKQRCATNAESANALSGWLMAQGLADDADQWLAVLPAELQTQPAVFLARGDCYLTRKDWPGLQTFAAHGDWGELEFMRLAMLARALRELHQDLQSQSEWRSAIRVSTDRPKQLSALAHLAARWNWDREEEDLLWLIVQRHPGERWALNALNQLCMNSGDTRGLHRLFSLLLDRNPDDVVAKNNFATVSFLLNLQLIKAHQYAREAYQQATNNAAFVSTYAYSLYLQNRAPEGRAVIEVLPPAQLTNASIALYYGALQTAMNPEAAKKYFNLAAAGPLLPEEKKLLAEMRRKLN